MSDLVEVPFADAMLVGLPPGVSPADAAACSCNVTDAYRCVGPQLLERPGARVLIVNGAFGNIGLYSALIALSMGAAGVDFVDKDTSRAAIAARLGANLLSADMVKSASYPITVDTSLPTEVVNDKGRYHRFTDMTLQEPFSKR
jgi:threonine dehydrogenase-like Zn-dependent dehydrogenase